MPRSPGCPGHCRISLGHAACHTSVPRQPSRCLCTRRKAWHADDRHAGGWQGCLGLVHAFPPAPLPLDLPTSHFVGGFLKWTMRSKETRTEISPSQRRTPPLVHHAKMPPCKRNRCAMNHPPPASVERVCALTTAAHGHVQRAHFFVPTSTLGKYAQVPSSILLRSGIVFGQREERLRHRSRHSPGSCKDGMPVWSHPSSWQVAATDTGALEWSAT